MKIRTSATGALVTASGDRLPWFERTVTFDSQEEMDLYNESHSHPQKKTDFEITDGNGQPLSLKDVSENYVEYD